MADSVKFSLKPLSKIPNPLPQNSDDKTFNHPIKIPPQTHTQFQIQLSVHFTTIPIPKPEFKSRTYFQNLTVRSLFTGIVEEMGEVKQLGVSNDGRFDIKIRAKTVLQDVHVGDSIAVNGTCLTVTEFDNQAGDFTVGLSPETLRKTSLSEIEPGSLVNLEEIVSMKPEEDSLWIKVKTDKNLLKYVVPKGFIAVDGTS